MRKAIASFLIAFMVAMPVLACCCPQDTQQNAHATHQHHENHEHHDDSPTSTHSEQHCAKTDLQVPSQSVSVQSSDLTSKVQFDSSYMISNSAWTLALANDVTRDTPLIFASPPDKPPVFLITQRLRI